MWLIVRELVGWILVAVGLAMIGFVLFLANNLAVLEALAVSLTATVVFRCGIGLVKLAFAARVATNMPVENVDLAG